MLQSIVEAKPTNSLANNISATFTNGLFVKSIAAKNAAPVKKEKFIILSSSSLNSFKTARVINGASAFMSVIAENSIFAVSFEYPSLSVKNVGIQNPIEDAEISTKPPINIKKMKRSSLQTVTILFKPSLLFFSLNVITFLFSKIVNTKKTTALITQAKIPEIIKVSCQSNKIAKRLAINGPAKLENEKNTQQVCAYFGRVFSDIVFTSGPRSIEREKPIRTKQRIWIGFM